jgi:hypothetical protein
MHHIFVAGRRYKQTYPQKLGNLRLAGVESIRLINRLQFDGADASFFIL